MKKRLSSLLLLFGGLFLLPAMVQAAGNTIIVIDSDGNGTEPVSLDGSNSRDLDGAIIDYEWRVNGTLRETGFGPKVSTFTFAYSLGLSTVTLTVRDDVQVSSQAVAYVTVKPQSANQRPVANAIVPSSVEGNSVEVATITVNASASSDPEGDPIFRYRWTEGTTTYFDGTTAVADLQLRTVGVHTLTLTVFSKDTDNAIQFSTKNFTVTMRPLSEELAGRSFNRIIGQDFAFSDTYGDFAGLTFNALTQTFFMTDNQLAAVIEINADGSLRRTIDIAGLKRADAAEADPEGITWMYGSTYAVTMETGEEMAIINITTNTTSISRANATIYDLSGDPKGIAYKASEDALYWVSEDNPMRVIKSKINNVTGELDELADIDVTGLPADKLADIAYFPRLSPHMLLVSGSSRTIMEVDLNSGSAVLKSSFSLTGWDIPEAGDMAFGADGKMFVVGKHVANTPEDDFNVFQATSPIPNTRPVSRPGNPLIVADSDGSGFEVVTVEDGGSFDIDGAIIDYAWRVNGTTITRGFGPVVKSFTHNFAVGKSTVTLWVRDDVQVSSQAVTFVTVRSQSSNLPPVVSAVVPSKVEVNSVNQATVTVNASASSDPEGDTINRYRWMEGANVLFDGTNPNTAFVLTGVGMHTLTLTVFSVDIEGVTQSASKSFSVELTPLSESIAGREFVRVFGDDFTFSDTYGDFAGITYNALTQNYFMTDNKLDKILEIKADGTLVRTIDIAGIKQPGQVEADAEGITWMYGTTYALVMESGEEMAIVNITTNTTTLTRANVGIHDLSGDPKGIAYNASEDALYWVSEDNPMRVVKAHYDKLSGELDELQSIDVTGLPADKLADVAYFPRLSQNLLLISHSSRTIMEVDLKSGAPVLKSSFSLAGWPIPEAGDLTFGADGRMYLVSKHVGGMPEDDFNIFAPTAPIPNRRPEADIRTPDIGGQGANAIDLNGNGKEVVLVDGSNSFDPDGMIITYEWFVNGMLVEQGIGPKVSQLSHEFEVGETEVSLVIKDDGQTLGEASATVKVIPNTSNLPPVASATVPPTAVADTNLDALVTVDASASSDPDGDAITRYTWIENGVTLFDGANASTSFSVHGLGEHSVTLTVYSTDSEGIIQSAASDFFLPSFHRPHRSWPAAISPA